MSKKKILIISHCFYPETMPINDVAILLKNNNYSIDVLTGKPNYPIGKIYKGYKFWGFQNEMHQSGFKIYRVPIVPRYNNSILLIILNYFSFILSSFIFSLSKSFSKNQYDTILVFSTSPIIQTYVGIFLKKKFNARLVTWIQDLWPNNIKITGYIKNNYLIKLITLIVKNIYSKSDVLLVQSPEFILEIKKIFDHKNIQYCPNPGHKFQAIREFKRKKHTLKEGFNFLYAGNIGKVQSLDILIKAAKILYLKKYNLNINLIGDGSYKKILESKVRKQNIKNVYFYDRVSQIKMKSIYDEADVLILSLQKNLELSKTIPGKLQTYMSLSKPILCFADGASKKIVEDANAGLVCTFDDPIKLSIIFEKFLKTTKNDLKNYSNNSLRYYKSNFDEKIILDKIASII